MPQGCLIAAEERFVLNATRFNFRVWDDGCVVHDHADGSLYALTPVAGELLGHLASRPSGLSLPELSELMLGQPEPEDDALMAELIAPLSDLGIVRVERP